MSNKVFFTPTDASVVFFSYQANSRMQFLVFFVMRVFRHNPVESVRKCLRGGGINRYQVLNSRQTSLTVWIGTWGE